MGSPSPPDNWNGPPRELSMGPGKDGSIEEDQVYCVSCGNIFVFNRHRDCPACAAAEAVEDLRQQLVEADVLEEGDDVF